MQNVQEMWLLVNGEANYMNINKNIGNTHGIIKHQIFKF